MKIIYLLVLLIIYIFQLNTVKSDDITCINNIFTELFGIQPISDLCQNLTTIDWVYNVECTDSVTLNSLDLTLTNKPQNSLTSPLTCFTSLTNIYLNNFNFPTDAFNTKVAINIYLYNCKFNQRLCTPGSSLAPETESLNITIDNDSNLKIIDFKDISKLINFDLRHDATPNVINYVTFENSLTSSDITNFNYVVITTDQVPVLNYISVKDLNLNLVNASNSNTFNNFATMSLVQKLFFNFNFDNVSAKIDYPISISSSNNVALNQLSLTGQLNPPLSILPLPPNIQFLTIENTPYFNIDGQFPFDLSLSNKLVLLQVDNLGLTSLPSSLPLGIENIEFVDNDFSSFGPISLPDFSQYKNLTEVELAGCGYTGPIPESFCFYQSLVLSNNSLNGTLPQCMACYLNTWYNNNNFNNNPLLSQGSCEPGSIVPNLDYDDITKELKLYGSNLGIKGPTIINTLQQFQVITPQSLFSLIWDQPTNGNITDTISMKLGDNTFTLSTKVLTPVITSITKSGNRYTFNGSNFSYNNTDIALFISHTQCPITYIDFNTIECTFTKPLLVGQDIPANIQNIKSTSSPSQLLYFTVNTAVDKTTIVQTCLTDCNVNLGQGICSSTTGQCICTQYYVGSLCDSPSQFLSSISSTLSSGGIVDMWGWFGFPNLNFSVKIGNQECPYHYVNSTFANCTISAGTGTQSVIINQNNFTWIGNNYFHYLDLTYKCPKNCSRNGECNKLTGQCACSSGWSGYDCNSRSPTSPSNSTSNPSIPPSNTTINETRGSATLNNQQTSFDVSLLSIVELDINYNIVSIYNLTNQWNTTIDGSDFTSNPNSSIYTFTQTIQESCSVTYKIEEVKFEKDYQFAGLNLTLDKGSIKLSVSIQNYSFSNALNQLQLRIQSTISEDDEILSHIKNNECNNQDISTDSSQIDKDQLFNYVTISKNQKTLYGRFINRVLSDSRETFITNSIIQNITSSSDLNNGKETFIIALNLPHCTNECTIDPDFAVLVSNQYKECSSNRPPWVLAIAIVVPIVGFAIIVVICAIIYRKHHTAILIVKDKYSLTNLTRRNRDDIYKPNKQNNHKKHPNL